MDNKIIKFCGIRRRTDIYYCAQIEPTHMGFVFSEQSKRFYRPDNLIVDLMSCRNGLRNIKKVGVFVNSDISYVLKTALLLSLDVIQLHGDEDSEYISRLREELPDKMFSRPEIWKALPVTQYDMERINEWNTDKIILDGRNPGSGQLCDWELIKKYRHLFSKPFILAGGINISNLKDAIAELHPDGIDLSSGIETDGAKDMDLMEKILDIVKEVGWELSYNDDE